MALRRDTGPLRSCRKIAFWQCVPAVLYCTHATRFPARFITRHLRHEGRFSSFYIRAPNQWRQPSRGWKSRRAVALVVKSRLERVLAKSSGPPEPCDDVSPAWKAGSKWCFATMVAAAIARYATPRRRLRPPRPPLPTCYRRDGVAQPVPGAVGEHEGQGHAGHRRDRPLISHERPFPWLARIKSSSCTYKFPRTTPFPLTT